ncbi:MAG: tRNA preQ1(34) S-adenosylmethionine ribosyltransferase-isomerase QueA [Patescibacteria group bacterium]|jgi:S-adenosylmethionine:tRNA ribosyltransferase-isomerase
MKTPISKFDYDLPSSLIAQAPMNPREQAKMLVLGRETGVVEHRHIFNLPDFFHAGDVLVLNETKVFRARLAGKIIEKEKDVEVFLLREQDGIWEALIGGRHGLEMGMHIEIGSLSALVERLDADGVTHLRFEVSRDNVLKFCEQYGEVPLPPYIKSNTSNVKDYQTVYAKQVGSVAAPTAGFHLTESLLKQLREKGVQIEFITLHVGLGTFRPVQTEMVENHVMHSEWANISPDVASRIADAKQEGRRIIAVGTTSVRTLEGVKKMVGSWENFSKGFSGDLNSFITPGFQFEVTDGMLTNFHLPKSTLLMLVSAFAGRERILAAYEEAKKENYRFFSFGDAMLLV